MPQASPTRRRLIRGLSKGIGGLHRSLYRRSGGRVAGHLKDLPILLLTTTGRKTGKARTIPLGYFVDGHNLVVIASNGGMDWSPAWWLNLKHDPSARIELGRDGRPVKARKASPEERARLWADVTGRFPAYSKYAQRTTREIPVVILEPLAGSPNGATGP